MQIRLLQDVIELDRHGESAGIKTTKKRNRAWGPPQVVYEQLVECPEPQFIYIKWLAGTVIGVSDETGRKFIDRGQAQEA